MVCIHPWYSSTHGIYPWYCKWYLPMVLAHGIRLWYCISKKAINNKPHFVKGQIVRHNVASTVILYFNKTSFFVVLFSLCSLFFSGIIILRILSDLFQLFRSWGTPPKIRINIYGNVKENSTMNLCVGENHNPRLCM